MAGIVAVDITPPLSSQPVSQGENILFVAHGLTGGSHESYVRAVLARVTSGGLGFRAVVLNFRGCNGSPVVTPRLYHVRSAAGSVLFLLLFLLRLGRAGRSELLLF